MRTFITFFLLLCSLNTHAQKNERLNDLVVLALNQAVDTVRIHNIRNILASKKKPYNHLFDYIPSLNPLNPKKVKDNASKFERHLHSMEKNELYTGLDFKADNGTAIHATASGSVIEVKTSNSGRANQVTIKHDYGFSTSYTQMQKFIVKKGDKITKGQVIGFIKNNGSSSVPVLHYKILKNNKAIDPYPFCFFNLQKNENLPEPNYFKSAPFNSDINTFLSQIKKNVF